MVPFSFIGLFVLSVADWSVLHCLKIISPHSLISAYIPFILNFKGEVHSRMAIYFLYANKKFIQKYVIHQNFSFQRALNPYEIFL